MCLPRGLAICTKPAARDLTEEKVIKKKKKRGSMSLESKQSWWQQRYQTKQ